MSSRHTNNFTKIDLRHELSLRLHKIGERGQETYYECPFCGSKEKSKFSVNYSKEVFKCYKCDSHGHVSKLLKHIGVSSSSIQKDSYDLKLDSLIEKSRVERKVSNKKLKFNGTLYNTYETETGETIHENVPVLYSFTYRDETGKELYQRYVGQSGEWSNKKQKYKKVVRPYYKENGESFLGDRPDKLKVFYGLESIKEKGVCLIFEGEKKRDYFEKILGETLRHETETPFFSLSGSGASQKIDQKTIQALKNKNVVQVFLVPDIDDIGEKFAQETIDSLKQNGIDSSIIFLGSYLPKEKTPFKGYDIEDLLKEYPNKINDILKYIKTIPRKKIIHSRYLTQSISSDSILSDPARIIIIKSIQGTGKTKLFEDISKKNKVLYASIRESLCRDASERMGLELYLNIENANFCREYTEALAVCLNSMHKFQYIIDHAPEYVVCIDEIDHTIRDLMTSPLFRKEENIEFRSKIFNILVKLIKEAKKVILTSADIPDYVIQFLKQAGLDDILIIENTYKDNKDYVKYFLPS
jgi:transcription elongation factor Elf1